MDSEQHVPAERERARQADQETVQWTWQAAAHKSCCMRAGLWLTVS